MHIKNMPTYFYEIQRLLGHSVISVTAKYAHLTSSALREASL